VSKDQLCLVERFDLPQVKLILLVLLGSLRLWPVRLNQLLENESVLLRTFTSFKFFKEIFGADSVNGRLFFKLIWLSSYSIFTFSKSRGYDANAVNSVKIPIADTLCTWRYYFGRLLGQSVTIFDHLNWNLAFLNLPALKPSLFKDISWFALLSWSYLPWLWSWPQLFHLNLQSRTQGRNVAI